MKTTRGRQPKPTSRKLIVAIRLNAAEHADFERAAQRSGKPLSVWFRDAGINAARK